MQAQVVDIKVEVGEIIGEKRKDKRTLNILLRVLSLFNLMVLLSVELL